MSQVFLKRGDFYSQTEGNFNIMQSLDDGIYRLHQNPMTGEIFLERIADSFYFGFKLYGIDNTFVSHVLDTYNKQETKRNIGILLNGAKGTGKTVTAKMLCNKLGLPVIIVDSPMGGLAHFLAGINHDCVFLFDEFEKNFRLKDDDEDIAGESLLSIMDGVYNTNNCHIFILTTNELRINSNLLSRPSRIRYLKTFNDVIDESIRDEYIDDNLKYPQYKESLIDYFDTLTIGTIDILKSLVDEINLHNCDVDEFKKFFNVDEASYEYCVKTHAYEMFYDKKPTVSEFLKNCTNCKPDERTLRIDFRLLSLNKSIKKFKKGDMVDSRNKIVEINLDKKIVLVRDIKYSDREKLIYFEDIDVKPNIYDRVKYNKNDAYDLY